MQFFNIIYVTISKYVLLDRNFRQDISNKTFSSSKALTKVKNIIPKRPTLHTCVIISNCPRHDTSINTLYCSHTCNDLKERADSLRVDVAMVCFAKTSPLARLPTRERLVRIPRRAAGSCSMPAGNCPLQCYA